MLDHPNGYRTPARLFHWGIAAAVMLLMIPAGLIMTREGLPRPLQDSLFILHKNLGVLLFVAIFARLAYRWLRPPPPLPDTMPEWQKRIAHLSHVLLAVVLVIMPLSGFTRVRAGGFPVEMLDALGFGPWIGKSKALESFAQTVHFYTALLLIALLAVHIGAALYHKLILRDTVWGRMWPPRPPRA